MIEAWLGRAQVRDLGIRLAGERAGYGLRDRLAWNRRFCGFRGVPLLYLSRDWGACRVRT